MLIHILSDLHNEFTPFEPPPTDASVVVLAGDIDRHTHGLEWARQVFGGRRIVYVRGNHEIYGAHLHGLAVEMRKRARELGIDYLDNDEAVIGGVRFLGTTLWTDFELFGPENTSTALRAAKGCMNDFALIRYGSTGRFLPEQSVILHRAARAWLEKKLAEPFDGPTVVVSHHCPSFASVAPQYQNDLLSAAFASCLDALVEKADLWVHGHTHTSFDYELGRCRVLCNPRGYTYPGSPQPENPWFKPDLVAEVRKRGFRI